MSSDTGSAKSADPHYEAFTAWSGQQGVRINGVQAAQISDRGSGIVAQRHIEAGEELVNVPTSTLLTEDSLPANLKSKFENLSIHGLLASFLASDYPQLKQYKEWAATWPTPNDFRECMPMLWPQSLRTRMHVRDSGKYACSMLPPAIGCGDWAHHSLVMFREAVGPGLLRKQEIKFQKDLETVQQVLPGISLESYRKDCLAMCPFADLFNHADEGCDVAFDDIDYTVTANRAYEPGEEVFVSYGSHSNDFLLVEYGFVLDSNRWDYVPIHDTLIPDILNHKSQRQKLDRVGYLGNYTLTSDGVCHRTQVAIRGLILDDKDFRRFVHGQENFDERDEAQANEFIATKVLQVYNWEAEEALQALKRVDDIGIQVQKGIMMKRWVQIRNMIQRAHRNYASLPI
ncbi:MAG: hypothetical protein HETSPECPRED_007771 [Heterodermia speciosa]|uniref:SET domain-containing protein n=1 Tax=Heterodermia speciosa TaxID=116794 RepID=A0A8H3G0P8_9LECA|nr:MAG: hypothetical protein HETSPECPRED_007771 [Heterodermia speciosa]